MKLKHLAILVLLGMATATAQGTLKVFLLAGQSNMEGHAYTYTAENSSSIPTLEYLLDTPGYVAILPAADYTFKGSLAASWLSPRTDAWAVQYDSIDGTMRRVEPTPQTDQGAWSTAILPLGPGFGESNTTSSFGPELGMGIHLADVESSPILLVKSNHGGRNLAVDFRPPSAVAARGGSVGGDFTNTVNVFAALLDALDADLGDDGLLNGYNNATGYEVCGFVWLQGWNDALNANMRYEYEENLVDLVHDLRASDPRIPADLPLIVPESADQNAEMNTARANAVATLNTELPGTAVFIENNNLRGNDWTAQGYPFTLDGGSHFNGRAENYLEIGWRIGKAVIDNGYLAASPLWLDAPEVVSTVFNGTTLSTNVNIAASGATIYWDQVDRGATSSGWANSLTLGAKAAGPVQAVLGSLSEFTNYVFRFHATSGSPAAGAWSAPGTFQTPWENPPPLLGTPVTTAIFADGATVSCPLVQAPATANTVVWAYDDQGDSDVAAWQNAPGGGSASLGPASPGVTLSHTITGLQANTSYTYRFFTTGASGYSWSAARSFPTGVTLDGVITPIEAVAVNSIDAGRRADKLIDGSGLSGSGNILTQTHSEPGNTSADYFLGSATGNGIVFTLPAAATVAAAHLWQYDRPGLTSRGFKTFDVSFSTDGGVSFPTTITLALAQGTGAPPTPVQTLGFAQQSGVTHIRFHHITNFGDPSWIGLSEVRFGSVGPLSLAQPTSSNIQSGQATVSTSVSQAVDAVTVYWDTLDHGPGSAGWSNTAGIGPQPAGAISHLLTGLAENVTYFFRFHATGAGGEVCSLPGSLTTGVAGSIITPAGVTATSSLSAYPIVNTINSSGLNSSAPSALDWTHAATPSNSNNYSWLGPKAGNLIVYQLPVPSTVGSLYYWSYWGGTASRSLTAFDISFSPDGVTYSTPSTITLGTPGSSAEFFSLGTHANVTHVRFSNLQNGGDTYAGIGEVRFGGQPSAPGGAFGGWAAGPWSGTLSDDSPTLDFDGGGLDTGIEWVVGGDPSDGGDDAGNAPTFDNGNATYFNFSFKRRDAAATDADTDIAVEYGSNLSGWAEAVHGTNGVLIDDSTDLGGGFHQVTVSIPRTLAGDGGKLFARLKVVVSTTP